MANLIDGKISEEPIAKTTRSGEFERPDSAFRGNIAETEAVANRYHLYVSYACPWAHRTLIMRNLKSLQNFVSFSVADPFMGDKGWTYPDPKDPKYLAVLYVASSKRYTGKVTVPVLWDKEKKTIINNESSEIIRIFNSSFNQATGNNLDFYPQQLRSEIDKINDKVYNKINNGVYKCGFASSQKAYDKNFKSLFSALDEMEVVLSMQPFLVGDKITEADIRLFTTLIRFDAVYYSHFKCNQRRIADYPHLYNYMKSIYQLGGVKETCHFDHIKQHYYLSHKWINPTGIVPAGPDLEDLDTSHNRCKVEFHHLALDH